MKTKIMFPSKKDKRSVPQWRNPTALKTLTSTMVSVSKKCDLDMFLGDAGLPNNFNEINIQVGDHGNVNITELDKDDCITLVMKIHEKVFFGRKVFCRPIIGLLPTKEQQIHLHRHRI